MRRYGQWAGNPEGIEEHPTDCVVEVQSRQFGNPSWQCFRKRGHGLDGLYCKQHARMLAEGRHVSVPEDEKEV